MFTPTPAHAPPVDRIYTLGVWRSHMRFWKDQMQKARKWNEFDENGHPDIPVAPIIASCAAIIKQGEGRNITLEPGNLNSPDRAAAYDAEPDAIVRNIEVAFRLWDMAALEDYGALADAVVASISGETSEHPEVFSVVANRLSCWRRCPLPECGRTFKAGDWAVSIDGTDAGAICRDCAQEHAPAEARLVDVADAGTAIGSPFPAF